MSQSQQFPTSLTEELCDRLLGGLDAIRKLVNEAITGEPSGVNTADVLDSLKAATTSVSEPSKTQETSEEIDVATHKQVVADNDSEAIGVTEPDQTQAATKPCSFRRRCT